MKKQSYKSRLQAFENEKKKLIDKNLTAFEFQVEIKKMADKYDI